MDNGSESDEITPHDVVFTAVETEYQETCYNKPESFTYENNFHDIGQ